MDQWMMHLAIGMGARDRGQGTERQNETTAEPVASFLVLDSWAGSGQISIRWTGLVPRNQTRNRGKVTPLALRISSAEVQGAAGGRSPGRADFTSEVGRLRRGASTIPRLPPAGTRDAREEIPAILPDVTREVVRHGGTASEGKVRGRHPMALRGEDPCRTEVPSRVAIPPSLGAQGAQ